MRKLSTYLFLVLFAFQTSSWADDIRDFQIEGMSIGDSLLNYSSEEEIEIGPLYPKSKKFIMVRTNMSLEFYDKLQFHTKRNDKKYITHSIEGIIAYENNIKDCYRKMDEVVNSLSKTFKNIVPSKKIPLDSTYGEGTQINFEFDSGALSEVSCTDLEETFRINKKYS